MNWDRNTGTWSELKAKRHNKFDEAPLESLDVMHSHLVGETSDSQKVKKNKTAKQLAQVKSKFKDMTDYNYKQDT